MRQDVIRRPSYRTSSYFFVSKARSIASLRSVFKLACLDTGVELLVEKKQDIGNLTLLRYRKIEAVVASGVPEVECQSLAEVGVNAGEQCLHLPAEMLNYLKSIVSISDHWQHNLDHLLKLLLFLECVEQLVCLIRPK